MSLHHYSKRLIENVQWHQSIVYKSDLSNNITHFQFFMNLQSVISEDFIVLVAYPLETLCLCLFHCFHISGEFIQKGVECFFDNRRLAAWADILFLCCLPSHIPEVCADLHSRLSTCCLVYSFTSAVPVTRSRLTHSSLWFVGFQSLRNCISIPYYRLARLLGHDFVLKPQYDFVACDTAGVWLSCTHLTTALNDPLLIKSSCPLTMSGVSWFIIADFNVPCYVEMCFSAVSALISTLY